MLHDSILHAIGRTPLVRINRIASHLPCNIFAKCEYLNPGGSVKDRIGASMVFDAEKSGRIKPGDTLIEPTSGNTGIGIALAGAVRGYRVIITMPEKMSREKQVVLEALGAEIVRTPTEAASADPESHIGVAKRLQKELPNAHILDQYSNPANPKAHFEGTGQEIIDDLTGKIDGKIDMIVMTAGTGGTITGVAKRIKKHNPDCIVIGVDPVGSILGGGTLVASYKVEGIGYDFIPDVLDLKIVDKWVKTNDRESFLFARRLIREEGLLCGGSSGAAIFAALQQAATLKAGQNCVVLLADGVRNYMTKFLDDKWMRDNHFTSPAHLEGPVSQLLKGRRERPLVSLEQTAKATRAVELMRDQGISQIPVTNDGRLAGMLTEESLLQFLASGQSTKDAYVYAVMNRNVAAVDETTPLNAVQETLTRSGSVVVIDSDRRPKHILTKIDLVEWMSRP